MPVFVYPLSTRYPACPAARTSATRSVFSNVFNSSLLTYRTRHTPGVWDEEGVAQNDDDAFAAIVSLSKRGVASSLLSSQSCPVLLTSTLFFFFLQTSLLLINYLCYIQSRGSR